MGKLSTSGIIDRLNEARRIVDESGVDEALRPVAYAEVFRYLLRVTEAGAPTRASVRKVEMSVSGGAATVAGSVLGAIAEKLGVSMEQVNEIYAEDAGGLRLRWAPREDKAGLPKQQQSAAVALLFGYRMGLEIMELPSLEMVKKLKEIDVWDKNLARNIKKSPLIRIVGNRKAARYGLAPGATARAPGLILEAYPMDGEEK